MKGRWSLLVWIAVAAIAVVLGVGPDQGFDHRWLSLALAAMFVASDARYWKPKKAKKGQTPLLGKGV